MMLGMDKIFVENLVFINMFVLLVLSKLNMREKKDNMILRLSKSDYLIYSKGKCYLNFV